MSQVTPKAAEVRRQDAPPAPTPPEARPAGRPRGAGLKLRVLGLGLLLTLIVGGGLVGGAWPHLRREREADEKAAARAAAPPLVPVAVVRRAPTDAERVLPGNCLAWEEAAIFPRTTGYMERRLADIGDRVKAGQL